MCGLQMISPIYDHIPLNWRFVCVYVRCVVMVCVYVCELNTHCGFRNSHFCCCCIILFYGVFTREVFFLLLKLVLGHLSEVGLLKVD